jgi:phosphatidylserine decarboxylase
MPIHYIDRKTGEKKEETIAGDKLLRWIYKTRSGFFLLESVIKRKLFSSLYGKLQDTGFSRRKIKNFVDHLQIDMTEAKIENLSSYHTFNHFFARELKSEARPINFNPNILISPADGRVLAWEKIAADKLLQVKGSSYSLVDLLQDKDMALDYDRGTCIVIRLCPSDYHRFHFPDTGIPSKPQSLNGHYYSVNPLALRKIPRLYCENKRELTVFSSNNFGDILMIEVGATCVGSIIQTYTPFLKAQKGLEKGYFKFGGSTIILLLKKDSIIIDDDILSNTARGIETKVWMGERIGVNSFNKFYANGCKY